MSGFESILAKAGELSVLVIGDAILDGYLSGDVGRICREAPAPVLDVLREEEVAGGAANTAANFAALGARAELISVTGDDGDAARIRSMLEGCGVDFGCVYRSASRTTLAKRRLISGGQVLFRFDSGTSSPIEGREAERLLESIEARIERSDAVVISDYGYGLLTAHLRRRLSAMLSARHIPVVVDARDLPQYRPFAPLAVKPNYREAQALLGSSNGATGSRADWVAAHGERILRLTGARIAAVTLDADGAVLLEQGQAPYRTYAKRAEHPSTAGAGDTFIAGFTIALLCGEAVPAAAEFASAAAAVVVSREGTAVCRAVDLQETGPSAGKLIASASMLALLGEQWRNEGRRIVFTNGCFDILHRGHVTCLGEAKACGDVLVVGVNADESVRKLKGPGRPINNEIDRASVIAGLSSVDAVAIFADETPAELIKALRPHVFVKGGDYSEESLAEAPLVRSLGGEVRILPYLEDRSTTGIVERIRGSHGRPARLAAGRR